jgi:hypothetical protein
MAINPTKHGQITANHEEIEANDRRRKPRSLARDWVVKLLKIKLVIFTNIFP